MKLDEAVKAEITDRVTAAFKRELAQPIAEELVEIWGYLGFVLTTHNLWSEDGHYTFPDGQTLDKSDFV